MRSTAPEVQKLGVFASFTHAGVSHPSDSEYHRPVAYRTLARP